MGDVVVVGGGVGGMAAALRLRAGGRQVVLVERRDRLGGKLDRLERDGFRFDVGPSLLTMPWVFRELWAAAGRRLDDDVELVRLDPSFRYRFADGSILETRDDPAGTAEAVEALSPGAAAEWRGFIDRGRRIWEVAEPVFLRRPLGVRATLVAAAGSPRRLLAVDPLRSLAGRAAASFTDPRLRQWAARYATYSGSSPWRVPATLACIPWIEQSGGCWYVRGGLGALRDRLAELLVASGVEVRLGTEAVRLRVEAGRVTGVELGGGERLSAAAVVANVDAAHLYGELLELRAPLRRVLRAGRSSSAVVLLLGVDGLTPGMAHHTVLFSADYRAEFADITGRGGPPADPTLYICCASVTDLDQAPRGCEAWTVLANVPGDGGVDWERAAPGYADLLLDVLARRGLEVRPRLRFMETVHPGDLERRHRTAGGAIYGTSSNGRRAAFLRPANRGALPGLYLAGGSSHPGGGLPLVALSGAIAAGLVAADLGP